MRKNIFVVFAFLTVLVTYSQETNVVKDTTIVLSNVVNDEEALKRIEAAEKARKKEEKAEKKAEKEEAKVNKLKDAIASKKKDIKKSERKISSYQEKLEVGKRKGKLSPEDELKIGSKISKEKLSILKDTDKLKKLERKL
ncbi:hypothetical protein H0I23_04255 [Cellulophaga sp. HaHaR_3_176]|uniref:hypothetical protein n=1 Tax=Cellulophaga sp. HaHaR_3_176 TaxID=1942464 RepID=UPI001C1FCBF7|nr:hypothetical protein [Cellulophaga sp. HaHaR_3_176]QWX84862.1 hypothetical protein H0I23_04255 [Cellulophaga sp. HaHaR_3_176]